MLAEATRGPWPDCPECGRPHTRSLGHGHTGPSCSAHRKRRDADGRPVPCGGMPRTGSTVCRMHGGSSRQVVAAAARRVAREAAMVTLAAELARVGLDIADVDEHEAIRRMLHRAELHEDVLHTLVGRLEAGGAIAADGRATAGIHGPDHLGDARPHVLWSMWREVQRDVARFAKMAADMGVAERQDRRDDRVGGLVADALEAVLRDLGVDPMSPAVGEVVARRLELLGGGAA